jgi:ribonuclease HI
MQEFIIYTDGGYSASKNVGAGAYVILKSDGVTLVEKRSFVLRNETSQRAEILAILAAVNALPYRSCAKIITDNLAAAQGLGKSPRRRNQPDVDLLVSYKKLVREQKLKIDLKWERGHNGQPFNELCDCLCTEALAEAEEKF